MKGRVILPEEVAAVLDEQGVTGSELSRPVLLIKAQPQVRRGRRRSRWRIATWCVPDDVALERFVIRKIVRSNDVKLKHGRSSDVKTGDFSQRGKEGGRTGFSPTGWLTAFVHSVPSYVRLSVRIPDERGRLCRTTPEHQHGAHG